MLKGEVFEDPQFLMNKQSICNQQSDWNQEWNDLKWQRAVEFFNTMQEDAYNSEAEASKTKLEKM